MARSPSSSLKNEPTRPLFSGHQPNLSFRSVFDTSIEDNLPIQTHSISSLSTSTIIDSCFVPSNETPLDHSKDSSAPTVPVYINMGRKEQRDDVHFSGPIATTNPFVSRSLAPIVVDHPLHETIPKRTQHQHHLPHHSQNRNRYPYLQRPIRSKVLNRKQASQTNLEAPPMPKHLYPGYRPNRPATSRNENSRHDNKNEEEEEDQLPSKSFWIILRLVFFFFAIEFMYAVETALTVPILTSLRVDEEYYSYAWLISPILGFFLQPMVGMWSDTCTCRWGRRRPFILAFAIGAYIGVALLLNSSDLGVLLGDPTETGTIPKKAIILTVIGVTLLDFCADSADAPIRAYLIDTTNLADQERGFNIHAILGFGGGLGFSIGAANWKHIPLLKHNYGGEFSVIYFFASVLFIVCTISTLTSVREEPLISSLSPSSSSSSRDNDDAENSNDNDEQPEIDVDEKRPLIPRRGKSSRIYNSSNKPIRSTTNMYFDDLNDHEGYFEFDPATGRRIPHDHVERTDENILLQTLELSHQVVAASISKSNLSNPTPVPTHAFEAELKQKRKIIGLGLMRRPPSEENDDYDEKDNVTIKSMIISMVRMPPRLWKLMICQVIGWVGYFATHLYFTDFVATEVYHGNMDNATDTVAFDNYKLGVTMGCWGLFLYSASSAVYAFCFERWLSERFSLKTLYFVGYFVYAIGCMVNFVFHERHLVGVNIAMCFTFGMLVVSLNTLPYHMLAQFHADETYKNRDGTKRGIGVDCSLLNSCYFLGELIAAASLGPLLKITSVKYCMVIGAAFTLIGNVCMFFLFYFKN